MSLEDDPMLSSLPRLLAWKDKGTLTVVDGVELFSIATPGFGLATTNKKPHLLILHGYPTASYDFHKIYNALTAKFEVLCWDFAGFGFSQKVYRTIGQQVDLLEGLLEQNVTNNDNDLSLHILSHDLGDTLVQEMIARGRNFSATIESIVMLNGGILPNECQPTVVQKLMLIPGINHVGAMLVQNLRVFSKSVSKVFGPHTQPTHEELRELHALALCRGGHAVAAHNIKYITERQIFHDRWVTALQSYAKHRHLLFLNGPADPVSGRHLATAVQEQIPGAKVVFLDNDIGHWPQIEAPKATIDGIMEFHKQQLGTF
ncbi:Mesoderm-specific transcript homolog protein [Seminavis robusta]|uniref:Mesoderm-specific transcript homolog protein n=1 Tax=Seminavis robusta TaxID=568900 RepID=A0A9N8HMG4_9STRA|nr:Mesoderm-specific transcript homolog protein [Seminavis robusta]|eukprot:Sro903_g218310.1 Mesoderm-specific transcript homolog protein (316) ;mRNA; r:33100-34047